MNRIQLLLDGHGRFRAVRFRCPGCNEYHDLATTWTPPGVDRAPPAPGDSWTFDGNLDAPTFSPSVRVRRGHYCNNPPVPGNCACDFQQRFPDHEPWEWPCGICHSFVRNGRIQFLEDCTHALAGQTVDLPEIDP